MTLISSRLEAFPLYSCSFLASVELAQIPLEQASPSIIGL